MFKSEKNVVFVCKLKLNIFALWIVGSTMKTLMFMMIT